MFRMPSIAAHAEEPSLRREPQIMAVRENTGGSCENFLREEENLCFAQAGRIEEKQTVLSNTRRALLRFLPEKQMQQSRFECRIPVSRPKFLVPPSERLIVGRYIRANPSYIL